MSAQEALAHRWLRGAHEPPREGPLLSREALRSMQRYSQTSRMCRALLQLLAQEVTSEETEELRRTFLALDKDHGGTITLSELKSAIRSSGSTPCAALTPAASLRRAPSRTIAELFETLDANNDQQIYYSDFVAATLDARSRAREETLRSCFRRLDTRQQGRVSAEDLKAAIGETFEGADVDEIMLEVAPRSGSVTFEEFRRVVEGRDLTLSPLARQRSRGRTSPEELLALVGSEP